MFTLEKGVSPNVVRVKLDCNKQKEHWILLRSDAHHDNPHCNWNLEKKHLDEALERDAGIIDGGDLFCAMQGAWDPRKSKSCLRPEHQRSDYLDALVTTAADFYQPYANNIICLGQGNHECVDPETEVLTSDGWVPIPDVTMDHTVASLHPHTGSTVWAKPVATHRHEYEGDMYHVQSRSADFMVTPNHRIAYFKQKTTELAYRRADELLTSSKPGAISVIPTSGLSRNPEYALSDDEIRLAAWIITDGSLPVSEDRLSYVYQSKKDGISKIRTILSNLGLEWDEQIRDREPTGNIKTALPQTVFVIRNRLAYLVGHGKKRCLPTWVSKLSDRQFEVFIQSYIDGDGTRRKEVNQTATAIYGTKAMLDDLQRECVTHGIRSSLSWRKVTSAPGGGHYVLNVCWRDKLSMKGNGRTVLQYKGFVYCLTTLSGNFFIRRNGRVCVTGNSSILKRHETNLTDRLAQTLRDRTKASVPVTGYSGWVKFQFVVGGRVMTARTLWHMHGYGGGGPVTVDNIQAQRQNAYIEGADIMFSGHVHERWCREFVKAGLTQDGEVFQRSAWYIKSATYKDEWGNGAGGWHVETGKPPKPLGAWWLKMTLYNEYIKKVKHVRVMIEVMPTT